jgi:hypothetical protein
MQRTKTDWRVLAAVAAIAGILTGIAGWQRAAVIHAPITLDGTVLASLAGAAIFAAVLGGGHFLARDMARGRGAIYGAAGAFGGLLAFIATDGTELIRLAAEQRLVSLALGLPLLIGAGLGAGYANAARIEDRADNRVKAIEDAVRASGEPAPALLVAGEAEYYSGPMQVRFSLPLMVAAGALFGVIVAGMVIVVAVAAAVSHGHAYAQRAPDLLAMTSSLIFACGIQVLLATVVGHFGARFFKATSPGSYVGYGFLANIALGLVTGVFLFTAPLAAVTLALYRKLAGLEPVGLPDDVRVRDRRALIGPDHPARRYHRVIADTAPAALPAEPGAG